MTGTDNNQVMMSGIVESQYRYSHTAYGEDFYILEISVRRKSEARDSILLMVSDRIADVSRDERGRYVQILGQFRSYNMDDNGHSRLILTVFVLDMELEDQAGRQDISNSIYLDGYVCRKPVYRQTPRGREISDVLLAVHRSYARSDYLPCICWGRNARFAGNFKVGAHIRVWGRIQSRIYSKKTESGEIRENTAYEISVSNFECIE